MTRAYAEFRSEQTRLGHEPCGALLTKRTRSLTVIRAVELEHEPVGLEIRVYDSPKTRELAERAGYLACNGAKFDITRYPDLREVLRSDRLPYRNPVS